jgi:recombination protein RecT
MNDSALTRRAHGNQPAQPEGGVERTLGQIVQQMRPELDRALPKHMSGDRMARLALTSLRLNPDLAQCTPVSFVGSLLTAAALGLEPGVNGEAYLVPYKRECTLIIGYQGYAKLFWQNPLAKHLDAQAVYEADEFDYAYGLDPFLTHKPAKGDRGQVVAYYAVATLSNGGSGFVVLSPEEVKALRGGSVGPSGKIKDPMRWMERKTAMRQLLKLMPRSAELNAAMVVDETPGSTLHAQQTHKDIAALGQRDPDAGVGEDPPVDPEQDYVDTVTGEVKP